MIKKPTLALVAALLAGSTSGAFASSTYTDPNTGLPTYIYYGPIAELQQQGLPISNAAKKYLKEHPAAQATAKRGNRVYLLEDTRGITAPHAPAYQYALPYNHTTEKHSGDLW